MSFKNYVDWAVGIEPFMPKLENDLFANAMQSKEDLQELERLAEYVFSGNKERGFWERRRSSIELSALIASELFEALEGARKPKPINVSFDFDQTLSREDVQAYAKELVERGVNVWICTSRYRQERVEGFNSDIFAIAAELGVLEERIIFTNTKDKWSVLSGMWAKGVYFLWHLDDDEHELDGIHDNTFIAPIEVLESDWQSRCNRFFASIGVNEVLPWLHKLETAQFKAHIKDTVEDELADTVIRCLDALGFYWGIGNERNPDLFSYYLRTVEFEQVQHKEYFKMQEDLREVQDSPMLIAEVHAITRSLMNAAVQHSNDEFIVALLASISFVAKYCAAKDINLAAHVKAKLMYNATRPYKHGKKF